MYTDLMLDLEYLAEAENAVITQISAIPFDISNGFYAGMEDGNPTEVFNGMPNIQHQLNCGRVIDEATMLWWMNQAVSNGRMPVWADDDTGHIEGVLSEFISWGGALFDWNTVRVWGHVRCDQGKIRAAYRDLVGMRPPWGRRNVQNVQTLRHIALGLATEQQRNQLIAYHDEKTHDALDDCVATIKEVSLAWSIVHNSTH